MKDNVSLQDVTSPHQKRRDCCKILDLWQLNYIGALKKCIKGQ